MSPFLSSGTITGPFGAFGAAVDMRHRALHVLGGDAAGNGAVVGDTEAARSRARHVERRRLPPVPDKLTLIAPLPGIQSGMEEQAESASAAPARISFAISLFMVVLS